MPLTAAEIATYCAFAETLADAAADQSLPLFRSSLAVDDKPQKSYYDPVTQGDRDAEKAMRQVIEATYSTHGILGEEWGTKDSQSGFTWVLDPIDGTRSFVAGSPLWTTLIALTYDGTPLLSVIDQPFIGERFVGAATEAETRSDYVHDGTRRTITTRHCRTLGDAVLTTTDIDLFAPEERTAFESVLGASKLARYSMDAYGYALLALGHIDIVVESGLAPYDVQPLIPVVRGAGGVITNWAGGDAAQGGQVVAAATAELHAEALALLNAAAT